MERLCIHYITSITKPDPTDGTLGMAWPNLLDKEDNAMTVVFKRMIDLGIVESPVFGFYLNRYSITHAGINQYSQLVTYSSLVPRR